MAEDRLSPDLEGRQDLQDPSAAARRDLRSAGDVQDPKAAPHRDPKTAAPRDHRDLRSAAKHQNHPDLHSAANYQDHHPGPMQAHPHQQESH